MTEVKLGFENSTSDVITIIKTDGTSKPINPGIILYDISSTGDFGIIYKSKTYPVKRKYINMMNFEAGETVMLIITDNITLVNPVFSSTYTTHTGKTVTLADNKAVIISFEQNIMITNATTGEWINIDPTSRIITILLFLIIIIFVIILISLGIYFYIRHR